MALQEGAIAVARQTEAVLVVAENLYGYGVAGNLDEGLPLTAMTRKGAVRARMSLRLFEAHAAGEIRAVSGRASDFFGPGVRMSALGERFWPDLIRHKPLNWFGNPDARHTFTYLPDFARALIILGAASDTWGRAWHVPSPETIAVRDVARRAGGMIGASAPRLRRTPRLLLRVVGLVQPAAAELIEMEYAFAEDLVMMHDDWDRRFGSQATNWEMSLRATLDAWTPRVSGAASAA
jgi:nucleoside-diphosphate-sugar epimerase